MAVPRGINGHNINNHLAGLTAENGPNLINNLQKQSSNRDAPPIPSNDKAASAPTDHGQCSNEADNFKLDYSLNLLPKAIAHDSGTLKKALDETHPVMLVRTPEIVEFLTRLEIPAVAAVDGKWTPELAEHVQGYSFCIMADELDWIDQTARTLDGYIKPPVFIRPVDHGDYDPDQLYDEAFRAPSYDLYKIDQAEAVRITAKKLTRRPLSEIPRPEFLYGDHLARKYVSVTVAPAGLGKSFLVLAETLAMITGKNFLNEWAGRNRKVWLWSEDETPLTELRVAAAIKRHSLDADKIYDNLHVNSFLDEKMTVAQVKRGEVTIAEPNVEMLIDEIKLVGIDVLVIDPFVKSHEVNENDNMAIDKVADAYKRIAHATGCAIHLVHHSGKMRGERVTVDSSRGASSLIGSARSVRTLNAMTDDEAAKAGLESPDGYFMAKLVKSNLTSTKKPGRWFHIRNLELDVGFHAGVIEPWQWPDAFGGLSDEAKSSILAELTGTRSSDQSPDWGGHIVASHMKLDMGKAHHKAQVKTILNTWDKNGLIRRVEMPDDKRNMRPHYQVMEGGKS